VLELHQLRTSRWELTKEKNAKKRLEKHLKMKLQQCDAPWAASCLKKTPCQNEGADEGCIEEK